MNNLIASVMLKLRGSIMHKPMIFVVTLLIYNCFSAPAFAGKLDKEVSGAEVNPEKPEINLDKYFSCSCQCGNATHNLPVVNDCSAYNGNRCVTPKPLGATDTYSGCVKTKETASR